MLIELIHIKDQCIHETFMSTRVSWTDNQEMGNNYYVRNGTYFLITGEILITLNGLRAQ